MPGDVDAVAGIVDEAAEREADRLPADRRVLEVEPARRRVKSTRAWVNATSFTSMRTFCWLPALVASGDDLALGRDDAPQGGLVAQREVAQGHEAGLRPVARIELEHEIAAHHAAVDVEEAQQWRRHPRPA